MSTINESTPLIPHPTHHPWWSYICPCLFEEEEPPIEQDETSILALRQREAAERKRLALLRKSTVLLPRFLVQRLQSAWEPRPDVTSFTAALLFADVAGFSRLTGSLALSHGRSGADRISSLLNAYLEAIIHTIYEHGGTVASFAGDAILACWPSSTPIEPHTAALAASCAIQLKSLRSNPFMLKTESHQLSLHVAVAVGSVSAYIGGGVDNNWMHTLGGAGVEEVTQLEGLAPAGYAVANAALYKIVAGLQLDPVPRTDTSFCRDGSVDFGLAKGAWRRRVWCRIGADGCLTVSTAKDGPEFFTLPLSPAYSVEEGDERFVLMVRCGDEIVCRLRALDHPKGLKDFLGWKASLEAAVLLEPEHDAPMRLIGQSNPPQLPGMPDPLDVDEATLHRVGHFVNNQASHVGDLSGELRRITALFVSIPSATLLDHEMGRPSIDLVQASMESVQSVVGRFEGAMRHIGFDEKGLIFIGAWGAERAHANDAELACLAGCQLVAQFQQLFPTDSFRMGIATGRAFCGTIGCVHRCQLTLLGEPVNLAAYLALDAKRRRLEICQETQRAVTALNSSQLAFIPLKPLVFKGRGQPVGRFEPLNRATLIKVMGGEGMETYLNSLWKAAKEMQDSGQAPATPVTMSVLLGREDQLSQFNAKALEYERRLEAPQQSLTQEDERRPVLGLAAALAGGGAMMGASLSLSSPSMMPPVMLTILQGPPGVGKTRLLQAFEHRLEESSFFNVHINSHDVTSPEQSVRLLPDALIALTPDVDVSLLQVEEPTVKAVMSVLRWLSDDHQGRISLIIDDAHLLSVSTLTTILAVCRDSTFPMVVCLAARPFARHDHGHDEEQTVFTSLLRLPRVLAITVPPLNAHDLKKLVQHQLELTTAVPDVLLRVLGELGGGNPWATTELIGGLQESRMLTCVDGRVVLANELVEEDTDRLVLPPRSSLEELSLYRFDRLPLTEQTALKMGAVFGRGFSLANVIALWPQAVAPTTPEDVSAALQTLVEDSFLIVEKGLYAFRQRMLRDTVYGLMPERQLRSLHAKAAMELKKLGAGGAEGRTMALHLSKAGGRESSARAWLALALLEANDNKNWRRIGRVLERAIDLEDLSAAMPDEESIEFDDRPPGITVDGTWVELDMPLRRQWMAAMLASVYLETSSISRIFALIEETGIETEKLSDSGGSWRLGWSSLRKVKPVLTIARKAASRTSSPLLPSEYSPSPSTPNAIADVERQAAASLVNALVLLLNAQSDPNAALTAARSAEKAVMTGWMSVCSNALTIALTGSPGGRLAGVEESAAAAEAQSRSQEMLEPQLGGPVLLWHPIALFFSALGVMIHAGNLGRALSLFELAQPKERSGLLALAGQSSEAIFKHKPALRRGRIGTLVLVGRLSALLHQGEFKEAVEVAENVIAGNHTMEPLLGIAVGLGVDAYLALGNVADARKMVSSVLFDGEDWTIAGIQRARKRQWDPLGWLGNAAVLSMIVRILWMESSEHVLGLADAAVGLIASGSDAGGNPLMALCFPCFIALADTFLTIGEQSGKAALRGHALGRLLAALSGRPWSGWRSSYGGMNLCLARDMKMSGKGVTVQKIVRRGLGETGGRWYEALRKMKEE